MVNPYLDYLPFPLDGNPFDWVGQKVSFKGFLAFEIYQHMVRPKEEWAEMIYLQPDKEYKHLSQLIGYKIGNDFSTEAPFENFHLRFYGSFGVLEGSSKRPGKSDVVYRESYFDLVNIEGLWNDPGIK